MDYETWWKTILIKCEHREDVGRGKWPKCRYEKRDPGYVPYCMHKICPKIKHTTVDKTSNGV